MIDENRLKEDFDHIDEDAPNQGLANNEELIAALRSDILSHLEALALPALNGNSNGTLSKEAIRASHAFQRREILQHEKAAFGNYWPDLLQQFADGVEVIPEAIEPELVPVVSGEETGYLFRFAALLWSVPVSRGYGRRMRYLVRDRNNGKLIGILALGDPVFNLKARDKWIGWDVNDRRVRLVHVMDAYVVGAVPPYAQLLGGKLVASLIGSAEVSDAFSKRYHDTVGIISGEHKAARLTLVTVTSALGRSSLYNRLKLTEAIDDSEDRRILVQLQRIGTTQGYGHFQLSNNLFERIRNLLVSEGHPYASGHQYGQGPNWRFRVMRVGLERLGLDQELTRHGIVREVYAMPLASNFREFLCGEDSEPYLDRPTVSQIASAALKRWIIPRSVQRSEYKEFRRELLLEFLSQ
jgi:hypothetical protein